MTDIFSAAALAAYVLFVYGTLLSVEPDRWFACLLVLPIAIVIFPVVMGFVWMEDGL